MKRLILATFFALIGSASAIAAPPPTNPFVLTFADSGGIGSSGSFNYPGMGTISWNQGDRPEDIFRLGMAGSFGFDNVTLTDIKNVTGLDIFNSPLSDFSAISDFTVGDLVDVIPGLGNTPINQVPLFADLASLQGIPGFGTINGFPNLLSTPISNVDLNQYAIGSIPGLGDIKLGSIPGIQDNPISSIPGLSNFPLFNPLTLLDYFVKFDIDFGMSECKMGWDCHERNIDNTASGNLKNMNIPCLDKGGAKGKDRQSCAHIEVRRNFINPTKNIRWISKEQKVPGGDGLGALICDEEPTGRFPLGPNPKVVLEDIEEKTGKIEFAMYFSVHVPLDDSDSAHCFGPLPLPVFSPAKEGDWILFGPDQTPPDSPFAGLGGSGPGGYGPNGFGPSDYTGNCTLPAGTTNKTYKGVDIASLKRSISNRESRGTGGYHAIGTYVGDDGAGNHGRGLGKYQFMSYGPARDIILNKPGGAAFLNSIDRPNINIQDFNQQVEKFFTPAEQEGLMDQHLRHLIDVAMGQGYKGDGLITRVAELHTGGEFSSPGVDPPYSAAVLKDYKSADCKQGTGNATGNLRSPVPGAPVTSPYGDRVHPISGDHRFHNGIDFGAAEGTPILAADGGTVVFAGDAGGCGNMVTIDHGNGFTTGYCHMSSFRVRVGDKVSPGQPIGGVGSTGNSTGPHLHFIVKRNGVSVDPANYLKGLR